jgi:hypothetical protein
MLSCGQNSSAALRDAPDLANLLTDDQDPKLDLRPWSKRFHRYWLFFHKLDLIRHALMAAAPLPQRAVIAVKF